MNADTIRESMRAILRAESEAVAAIPVGDGYVRAVETIIDRVHVLLLVSNSGKTREILELIDLADGLYDGLPKIVITGAPDSPLAQRADAVLLTGAAPEVCPLGLTPTTSTTVMTVIGDILVVNVMNNIDFSRTDYARRHHGGYLGVAARGENR